MYHSPLTSKSLATVTFWDGSGVSFRPGWAKIPSRRSSGGSRGSITSFSSASARRLRLLLLTRCGTGRCWSASCTLRGDNRTPSLWRSKTDAFGKRIVRLGLCCVWRVELQRRGVPHLHLLLWGGSDDVPVLIRDSWLGVWSLSDQDHINHAVVVREVGDTGWLSYMASHAYKHKADQLGWIGRQWGVWGRSLLHYRDRQRVLLTAPQASYFVRLLHVLAWLSGRPSMFFSDLSTWVRLSPPLWFKKALDRAQSL